ncbi:hypothetical protein N7462_001502 [Penicillium macrosclerotiorum]|uniref:uncharacterized protein n=1 Tax=Penicillium macrosclerotiorum TaxID=303699 RepID=UPI0025484E22|nr:uncharacterized protein N7462_001502 [Penicillium macrosclerotiorum]KAJ5692079.1 hypothetical protein N7462_001502 [Penicillium macrosclerotiorum]
MSRRRRRPNAKVNRKIPENATRSGTHRNTTAVELSVNLAMGCKKGRRNFPAPENASFSKQKPQREQRQ